MLLKGGIYVKYKLQGDYLTLIIDDDFHHKTIRDIFNYLHLSKKTIHLLKQDKWKEEVLLQLEANAKIEEY